MHEISIEMYGTTNMTYFCGTAFYSLLWHEVRWKEKVGLHILLQTICHKILTGRMAKDVARVERPSDWLLYQDWWLQSEDAFVASAMQPSPHSDELPVPTPPEMKTLLICSQLLKEISTIWVLWSLNCRYMVILTIWCVICSWEKPSELLESSARTELANAWCEHHQQNDRFSKHFANQGELCYCENMDRLFKS